MKILLRILIVLFSGMGILRGIGMIVFEKNLFGIFFIIFNLCLIAFGLLATEAY